MLLSFSPKSIKKLLPRWAIYLPVILLILFSALNFYRVFSENATNWAYGGWALHSTYDSMLFRFVRLYGVNSDGSQERIKDLKYIRLSEPVINRPIERNAKEFIQTQVKRGVLGKREFRGERLK